MAAGSRRAVRGMRGVWIGLAAALAAALPGGHGPARGAVDPVGRGLKAPAPEAFATQEAPPTRVTLGPGGRDVRLSGELTEGAAERLGRLLDANGAVERIHLTSEGGLVDEGAAIGALVAARGLVTYVPDYCVSACTLAFVRGRERLVLAEARLGFHAPYEPGPFGLEVEADSAPERAAYLAAGLRPDFVDAALKVRPDDLLVPGPDELVAAGVATGVVDAYRFPDSTLDDGADPRAARAAVLRGLPVLEGGPPAALVEGIAGWYLDGYARGRSEGSAADGMRRMAARALGGALRGAEPEALADLARLTLRATERAGEERARACAAAGEGVGALLTRPGLGRSELAAARAILTRALADARVAGLPEPDEAPARPASRACAALRQALAAALALPPARMAAALDPLLFPEPARPRPALEASAQPR